MIGPMLEVGYKEGGAAGNKFEGEIHRRTDRERQIDRQTDRQREKHHTISKMSCIENAQLIFCHRQLEVDHQSAEPESNWFILKVTVQDREPSHWICTKIEVL